MAKEFKTILVKCYEARSPKGEKVVSIHYPADMDRDEVILKVTGIKATDSNWMMAIHELSELLKAAAPTALKYSEDLEQLNFKDQSDYMQSKQWSLFEVLKELGCRPLNREFGVSIPSSKLTVLHKVTVIPSCKGKVRLREEKLTI